MMSWDISRASTKKRKKFKAYIALGLFIGAVKICSLSIKSRLALKFVLECVLTTVLLQSLSLSLHLSLCLGAILVTRLTCVGRGAWSQAFDLWQQTHDNEVTLGSRRIYAHWI